MRTGLAMLIVLISLMLIVITVGSVINGQTIDGTTTEEDYNQIIEETIDEITGYIMIKDQKGKYDVINGEARIDKVALWIKPLISKDLTLSEITIQLDDGENVKLLKYDNDSEDIQSKSLFEHFIWDNMTGENFGFISIVDIDSSIIEYDIINDCSDNAYLVFRLPEDMTLAKYEKITVTIIPSTGLKRVIELEAPFSIKPIVTFE